MDGAGGFFAGSIFAKLVLDKTGWNQSVQAVGKDQAGLQGMSAQTSLAFSKMGAAMTVAGGLIVGALGACLRETDKYQKVQAQLNAVLASTGGVAGVTAQAAEDLANALQDETTFSNGAVLSAENLLLTFTKINKDIFPQATALVLDMSTALGQDLKSSAIQLGKALQDPVLGVTALRRVGVNFNEDQQKVIKSLVETGRAAEAQQLIIKELTAEFGGSARAAAQTFSGQMAQVKNNLSDAARAIGTTLMPTVKQLVEGTIKPAVAKFKEWAEAHPQLVSQIAQLALKAGLLLTALGPMMIIIPKLVGGMVGLARGAQAAITWIKGLTAATAAGTLAWTAAVAAIGYYIVKLQEKAQAEGYAAQATARAVEVSEKLRKKLEEAMTQAGMNKEQIAELEKKYRDAAQGEESWVAAMGAAIHKGKEGEAAQRALVTVGKEHAEQIEKQRKAAQGLGDDLGDLTGDISAVEKAHKEYVDWMKSAGVITVQEESAEISKLMGYVADLDKKYSDGQISQRAWANGLKQATDEAEKLGINLNRVLPPARSFADLISRAPDQFDDVTDAAIDFNGALREIADQAMVSEATVLAFLWNVRADMLATMGVIIPKFDELGAKAETTTTESKGYFDGLWNDIASGFGSTVEAWISGGTTFKDFMKGLWDDIKKAFFRMVGEMVATEVLNKFKGLFSDIAGAASKTMSNAASSAASAVSGITQGAASAMTGLWTGLGAAVGTFLGSVFQGGPSGHAQQQQINDAKDSRNYLADIKNWLFSAGSGFGGAIWDYSQKFTNEKIDEAKGFIAEVKDALAPRIDTTNSWLDGIYGALKNLKSAAGGAVSTTTELVAVHGTPSNPEYIIPAKDLASMAAAVPSAQDIVPKRSGDMIVNVNVNGQIVTDREYTRSRLIPEIIAAARSGLKSELQAALGVA